MAKQKREIVTFKVDPALSQAMRGIDNRSEFIRKAILAALENGCPLCGGAGVLTVSQKRHWEAFARDHTLEECADCHELHLTCSATQ